MTMNNVMYIHVHYYNIMEESGGVICGYCSSLYLMCLYVHTVACMLEGHG